MKKYILSSLYACMIVILPTHSQNSFFNVFNNLSDVAPAPSQGASTLSLIDENDNWSMGTEWTPQERYDETDVFNVELQHRSNKANWNLRIGKGGQIYSWNLEGTGELIPPQGHSQGNSPWVDDAILMTMRSSEIHDNDALLEDNESYRTGFVHAAGMYIKDDMDPSMNAPFFNPLLAESFNANDRSYSCINLGLIPKPNINRADLIFYHKYKHLGNGVIEINYYGYNYSDQTYDDCAFPWAMVRRSVFPNTVRSKPDGGYETWGEGAYPIRFNIKDQGGWLAKTTNGTNGNGTAISIVHGLDRHRDEDWIRSNSFASSGISSLGDKSTRDYNIMTNVMRPIIPPGTGFFFRTYMVLDQLSELSETSYDLVDHVDYGPVNFSETSTELLPLYRTTISGQNILTADKPSNNATPIASTYALPVENSVPLFLLKDNTTNKYYLSTDQYSICGKKEFNNPDYPNKHIYQKYDGKTEWVALLGYVMPSSDAQVTNNTENLSTVLGNDFNFIQGEKYASSKLLVRTDDIISPTIFTPDPNKRYYIDVPIHNLRLAATGEGEDAYTVSRTTEGADVEWKFVTKGNGSWHIDRAAGGSIPRLKTRANGGETDMHSVSFTGNQTYWDISRGYEEGTYFLSLPDFSSDFTRLQVDPSGNINMVPQSFNGSWESFIFTEVTPTTRVVHLRKRNASGFAIDGNHGGENGQDVYLWSENENNQNQQWLEIDRGNGYYSYQKIGTNFAIDGGNGGVTNQNVYLWPIDENNQNQHWQKVDAGGGAFKLVKRNATGFALNGGNGGANGQSINLFDSSNSSQNLQWFITPIDGVSAKSLDVIANKVIIYPNPVVSSITIQGAVNTTLRIYDMNGKVVLTENIVNDSETIDLSSLASGVYYGQVNGLFNTEILKIVKQ